MAAFTMMMGYVFWDIVSPLSTTLKAPISEGGMGWTAAEYGFYAGSYSIFNIFLLMLFFGGIILDKCGIRITGLLATGMMFVGALINWYAVSHVSPLLYTTHSITLFGLVPSHLKTQVLIAAMGFGMFGVGCDITGITVSKIITKWFSGHELASAMGVQVAMARLGTASAISLSPVIAQSYGLSAPLFLGAVLLFIGFTMFVIYLTLDKKRTAGCIATTPNPSYQQEGTTEGQRKEVNESSFSFRDFVKVLRNPGFWIIALLCVFFYSSIRPFMKFTTDLLINKYGVEAITAGWITAILPYGTIVLTPLFGNLYDRIGRGATLMFIGCVVVAICHLLLALPTTSHFHVLASHPAFAIVIMVFFGIAFSLVPSAMWPTVPKIVPINQLGTAYSIIYYVQNIGLMLTPMLIGNIIDKNTGETINYTPAMTIFALFAIVAAAIALLLLRSDRRHNYGIEKPNIQNGD